MKPVKFELSNAELQASGRRYSVNVTGVDALPVWSDGEQCVSCWSMSFRERVVALLLGRVWLAVLSGRTQPPVYVEVSRRYLEEW